MVVMGSSVSMLDGAVTNYLVALTKMNEWLSYQIGTEDNTAIEDWEMDRRWTLTVDSIAQEHWPKNGEKHQKRSNCYRRFISTTFLPDEYYIPP